MTLSAIQCLLSILAGSGFWQVGLFSFTSQSFERCRHNVNNYLISYTLIDLCAVEQRENIVCVLQGSTIILNYCESTFSRIIL